MIPFTEEERFQLKSEGFLVIGDQSIRFNPEDNTSNEIVEQNGRIAACVVKDGTTIFKTFTSVAEAIIFCNFARKV